MSAPEDILERARKLSAKQQKEVIKFMDDLEFRDRTQSTRTTEPTPPDEGFERKMREAKSLEEAVQIGSDYMGCSSSAPFKRDSGPGPWCEQCGTTMGMHGGEWLCNVCSPREFFGG